jgi:hypothetical protein
MENQLPQKDKDLALSILKLLNGKTIQEAKNITHEVLKKIKETSLVIG